MPVLRQLLPAAVARQRRTLAIWLQSTTWNDKKAIQLFHSRAQLLPTLGCQCKIQACEAQLSLTQTFNRL